jgi:hypothetical protein
MRNGRFDFSNRHTGHQLSNHISSWTPIDQVTESNADECRGKQSVCDARIPSSGKQPIFTDFNYLIVGQNIIIYIADFSIFSYLNIFQNCVIFQ